MRSSIVMALRARKSGSTVAIVQSQSGTVAHSRLAMAAGIMGLVVDLGYLAIILDEAERDSGRVAVVFLFILAVSTLAFVGGSAFPSLPTRVIVLGAASGGLLTVGVLGIFSIGLPLLVAGAMCAVAWARLVGAAQPLPGSMPLASTIAAIASGGILLLGMALT